MDIVGGVRLADGSEAKIVSGVDDHSRFCISALVVARATARPTCDALALAMRRYGVPEEILTDNGKVFTGRFGPGTGEVLFDRICRENGIKHLLDRAAVADHDRQDRALAQDAARRVPDRQGLRRRSTTPRPSSMCGSQHYNHDRPHQSHRHGGAVGTVPARRHQSRRPPVARGDGTGPAAAMPPSATRRVSVARARSASRRRHYKVGRVAGRSRPSRSSATAGWCRSITAVC